MEVSSVVMRVAAVVEFFWIAGAVLQLLLAATLMYRRAWRNFPFFVTYSVINLLHAAACLIFRGNPVLYFYVYWVGEGFSTILGFLVVYEVFKSIFLGHPALRKLATTIFSVSLLILGVFAIMILAHEGQTFAHNVSRSVIVVEEATRTIEAGLLIVLFSCAGAFGLHWRQSVFGIALGLGIFVSVELIAVTLRSHISAAVNNEFAILRAAAYTTSLFVWGTYMLLPERAADESELPQRGQLEQWNQAMMELIHQ